MFCRKCGEPLDENAKFCSKCGTSTNTQNEIAEENVNGETVKETKKIDNDVVKYVLKPTFNYGYKICSILGGVLIFILVFAIAMLEEIDLIMEMVFETEFMQATIIVVIAVVIIYTLIKLLFEKKQYDKLEYNFYNNKLEYVDGFINKEEKELKYKNVREVTMTQSIVERMFGLGTIRIFTNASSGGYGRDNHGNMNARNGIVIHCVKDVRENYKKVKEIIDEGTEE